mgnify:FL=1
MKRKFNNKLRKKFELMTGFIVVVAFIIIAIAYKDVKAQENVNDIIPKPLSFEKGVGEFNITNDTSIYIKGKTEKETDEINKVAEFIKGKLQPSTGFEFKIIKSDNPPEGNIYLTTIGGEEVQGDEGYKIITDNQGIKIISFKPEGISRGVQTLRQLFHQILKRLQL